MAKRSTIGKDPFSDGRVAFPFAPEANIDGTPEATIETNVVDLVAVAATKEGATRPQSPDARPEIRVEIVRIEDAKARRAVGGRLEILGGTFGAGVTTIWRHGTDQVIGFFTPTGRMIDLGAVLDRIAIAPDRTEHRVLSTLGWAWVIGSLGGIVGVVAGGGLRLLSPRRMIVQLWLTTGETLIVRTDSVTASGLAALARRKD